MVFAPLGGGAIRRVFAAQRPSACGRAARDGAAQPTGLLGEQCADRQLLAVREMRAKHIGTVDVWTLAGLRTFDGALVIDARLDALPAVSPHLLSIYEELRRGISDESVGAAVDRLIARSQWFPVPLARAGPTRASRCAKALTPPRRRWRSGLRQRGAAWRIGPAAPASTASGRVYALARRTARRVHRAALRKVARKSLVSRQPPSGDQR